ncbi:CBS domain-containing protein [Streptomyces sodiiphilus]|uniref:CBS domain-containing protein n=1 Tax=Streptomyces sodiiphilus TaxID=226217 RepID=A0ABN2P826_9ACTN
MKHRKIGHVMTGDVVAATPDMPYKDIVTLLTGHRISGLPVVDGDEKVLGVISETDVVMRQAEPTAPGLLERLRLTPSARRAAAKARARTAGELMTSPAITIRAYDSVTHGARVLAEHRIGRLPVVDEEDRLVGIVTRRDLLGVFLRPDSDIRAEVIDEVLLRTLWVTPNTIGVTVTDGVVTLAGRLERSSEVPIAVRMTRQVDGVVAVVDHLTYRYDDAHAKPAVTAPAVPGAADDWRGGH